MKKKDKAVIVNISLPESVYNRLLDESEKIGLNRSAYISMTLSTKWANEDTLAQLPTLIQACNGLQKTINKATKKNPRKLASAE